MTSCNPNTELLRTLEHTKCGSACNECCNNQCSVGSLSSSCPSGYYSTTSGSTKCGNTCYSCVDCGGYKSKPSGCYSCTSRSCGGETRYDCTTLSDSCPSGSSKNPSCSYGKTEVGTTQCGSKCYTCNECSNSCSKGSTSDSCPSGYSAKSVGSTQCGNTCYECEKNPEECTPTRDCSSYSILYAGAMQSGTYDTCDNGCGTKRYNCKSGYTYSDATKRCESGGSSGGGSGSTTYDASLKCTSKGTVTQYTHCPNQRASMYSCTFTANSSVISAKIFSNGKEEAGSIRGNGTTYTVYGCGPDLRAQFYASNKLLCDGTLTKDSYGYLVKSCKY